MSLKYLAIWICLMISCVSCGDRYQFVQERNTGGYYLKTYYLDKDSILQGESISYYDEGKIFEKSYYKDGKLNGQRLIYFDDGQLEIEEYYINGVLQDSFKIYHGSGHIELKGRYIDGSLEGIVKKYYPSGILEEVVSYENDLENGPFTEFYENGNKKWEGTYLNGDNEFGELLKYDEDGVLVRKLSCDSLAICRTIWTLEE